MHPFMKQPRGLAKSGLTLLVNERIHKQNFNLGSEMIQFTLWTSEPLDMGQPAEMGT